MAQEFEVKYALPAKALYDALLEKFSHLPRVEKPMSAVYFDTETGDLSQRKWTLRLRQEGETSLLTMKNKGQGYARGEWEYPAASMENCAETLCALGAPAELKELLQKPLIPVCGARFTRVAMELALGETRAELALDRGELFRGETTLPLCELEVEWKEGRQEDVVAIAKALAEEFSLREEPKSKFQRAVEL